MAKKIDITQVSPERARKLLLNRVTKARAYAANPEMYNARNRAWQSKNPEKQPLSHSNWSKANSDHVAAKKGQWYQSNRDLQLARARCASETLTDSVVKSRFTSGTGLSSKDVPAGFVPVIRKSLLIGRLVRKKSKGAR